MYKLCPLVDGLQMSVQRLSDNAFIPFDPANTDYQAFGKWLLEGNRPEPAEEGGVVTDEWIKEAIDKAYNNRSQ